ncbi:MAG TPA: SDR family oxidoreductase [Edaphobacter sp.]|uniref:SDR family oxidoreductase n=1 Tax=Edaphobacter sp. TaxID=1934404 RepID=UPI002BC55287|nr:SDR family oxidoreductase [Edaphobacter sp.]HUZ96528.1 SDR family oxidoreductase [Edaphobacter sp.]
MKIVVLGGTGLIGSRVVRTLAEKGHDVLAASASTVDLLTGRGLSEALEGAQVVVDLTNSPSFEDAAVLNFFTTAARNLFPAEAAAGVKLHVALSIVGADRMENVGYMRAKVAQEDAIKASGIPYTIVRATQFFEFIGSLADAGTQGGTARLSNVLMQPIAADDIAGAVAKFALEAPKNGYINVAGPERRTLDELARELFKARNDPRQVVTDPSLGYFGGQVPENALVPDKAALLGTVRFSDWLTRSQAKAPQAR